MLSLNISSDYRNVTNGTEEAQRSEGACSKLYNRSFIIFLSGLRSVFLQNYGKDNKIRRGSCYAMQAFNPYFDLSKNHQLSSMYVNNKTREVDAL